MGDIVEGVGERIVPTPLGEARLLVAAAQDPRATLVLGHGAGGGAHARELAALAAELPAAREMLERRIEALTSPEPAPGPA